MDKDLKRVIDESLNVTFKSGIPISGEEKYFKQQPGGTFATSNVDGIMQEIQSIDEDSFRVYNDTLCPALWNESLQLEPSVRSGLMKVVEDFYEKTGFKAPIIDVYLMGSIANYNWTPDSDADIHIIINYDQLQMPKETTKEVVRTVASQWNSEHEVTVKGHKVEINLQNVKEQKPHVTGIYSLKYGQWIRQPVHQNVQINKMLVQTKYKAMKKYVEAVINSGDRDAMKQAKKYIDAFRQYGLDTIGELSVENLVFKALRTKGLLTQLKNSIVQVYDKEMTVREVNYKNINQAHPNVDKFDFETGDYDFSKLTLDNLKALKEKSARFIKAMSQDPDKKEDLAYEISQYKMLDSEIKRRMSLINAPVAINNPNEPFEEGRDDSWISPNIFTSYLDVGHHKGSETYLWIWHDGEFKVKHVPKYNGKLTHSDYFGNRRFDWFGRYDPNRGIVSISNNVNTASGDVPEELQRLLHNQFGTSVKYMRLEGYGAGIPETDRLKIKNQNGSVKRWQVRSKDSPKTPKMEDMKVGGFSQQQREDPLTSFIKQLNQGSRTDLFPEDQIPPEYTSSLQMADRALMKRSNKGEKSFDFAFVDELLDDVLTIEIPHLAANLKMHRIVKIALMSQLAKDYDILKDGKKLV
jgi:hypothetical protein